MLQRHLMRKQTYPDMKPDVGMPYDGMINLGPETQAMLEEWMLMRTAPEQ